MLTHGDIRTADLLARVGDGDNKQPSCRLLEAGMQELTDAELAAAVGAAPHERSGSLSNQRNGQRLRVFVHPCRRCRAADSKAADGVALLFAVSHTRRLDHVTFASVYLDATYMKARIDHRTTPGAAAVITDVISNGDRQVLTGMAAATAPTILVRPTAEAYWAQLHGVMTIVECQFPKAAAILGAADVDVLADTPFSWAYWPDFTSLDVLDRIDAQTSRRSNALGIFPGDPFTIRLVDAVLLDRQDYRAIMQYRYLSETPMAELHQPYDADRISSTTKAEHVEHHSDFPSLHRARTPCAPGRHATNASIEKHGEPETRCSTWNIGGVKTNSDPRELRSRDCHKKQT